jgi:hypothetical protein
MRHRRIQPRIAVVEIVRGLVSVSAIVKGGYHMEDMLVGILALILGLAVAFTGLRLWFVMLPFWGFVAGFFIGAAGFQAIFGDGFLSTVTGWVIGFFAGLFFAAISYIWWYAGAIIAAGTAGALLGSGLMAAIGIDNGFLLFVGASIGALLFALGALMFALPIFVVIVNTAIAGAAAVVTGAMLILNRVNLEELQYGPAWTLVNQEWFWLIGLVAVAVMGIGAQLRMVGEAQLPQDHWVKAQPAV